MVAETSRGNDGLLDSRAFRKQRVSTSRWLQMQAPGTRIEVACDHDRDLSSRENNALRQERRRVSRDQVQLGGGGVVRVGMGGWWWVRRKKKTKKHTPLD